jgi:hypothetical protein
MNTDKALAIGGERKSGQEIRTENGKFIILLPFTWHRAEPCATCAIGENQGQDGVAVTFFVVLP